MKIRKMMLVGGAAAVLCGCVGEKCGCDVFANLPEGTDPATVSQRLSEQFLSTPAAA